MKKISYPHMNMTLEYLETEMGLQQTLFRPCDNANGFEGEVSMPNFQLAVAGMPHGFHSGVVTGGTFLPLQMKMEKAEKTEKGLFFTYRHPELELTVDVEMQMIPGTQVIRQVNRVTNTGSREVVLTHFSTMSLQGIATDGLLPWYHQDKLRLHYCIQSWEGEGQWRSSGLEELGMYPNSVHQCMATIHFSSIGSWSTSRHLPMAMLEDQETGQIWYFQIETSSAWHYEVGLRKRADGTPGTLYMVADGADERYGGWSRKLQPGESFESVPVAFGCCKGGVEEAVKELARYRRTCVKPADAWKGPCPVVFNDYMNCLWGDPTEERLIPLIEAASEAGAEAFCIDAGWFGDRGISWGIGIGDWEPSRDRFGEEGLKGILDYIRSRGMIPGLWLEVEACQAGSKLYNQPDSWFLTRHGKRIGGERCFLDFRNPEVRGYVHGVIDRLVALGAGYFKNDYNQCTGNGDDTGTYSAADGLLEHVRAFYSFIDEVRERHPGVILENCGSGALREDNGILAHFHLQSTSDQEIYFNYPSIITGSLAAVLPEQAGIWAYPMPRLFNDLLKGGEFDPAPVLAEAADGEETIFNMVSGMCGNLYLSGHIEAADPLNRDLIREGVSLYKKERVHIHHAYPVWPTGFCPINHKGWASQGLISEDGSRMLLAVWRLGQGEDYFTLDLSKWAGEKASVRQLYPASGFEAPLCYNPAKGTLTLRFDKRIQARYYEVNL